MNGSYINQTYPKESDLVDTICNKYAGPAMCLFGTFGNVLNLMVLTRKHLKESPYAYLKALAITDLCALVLSFPFMVFSRGSFLYSWKWYDAYVFIPLVNFFTFASLWVTVIMTIDRFIFVRYPLWARQRCNRFKAQVRIWIIMVIAVLFTIPRFFCYDIHEVNSKYYLSPTPFRNSNHYSVMNVVCIVLIHFSPLLILSAINVYLIVAVQKARLVREELNIRNNKETEWQKDQKRFTITLISIVMLCIISILPAAICDLLELTKRGLHVYKILRNISNFLMVCNLSMNFVLYCAFNKRFVCVLKRVLGKGFNKMRHSIKHSKATDSTAI